MWDGAGCVGAVFGEVRAMACLHPSAGCPQSGPGSLTLNARGPGFEAACHGLAA